MKFKGLFVAMGLLAIGTSVLAAELKSGLQPGKVIGAFDVLKCSGADDDGVETGTQLCYRCRYGSSPMVIVFSRRTDKELANLATKLNETISDKSDSKLRAFVNLIGEDQEALEKAAKEIGTENKLSNVPVVVPVEFKNGPEDYGLNLDAEVTVIVAKNGKVVSNFAYGKDELNEDAVKSILGDVSKVLK